MKTSFGIVALLLFVSLAAPTTADLAVIVDETSCTVIGLWFVDTSADNYGTGFGYSSISTTNGAVATYTPEIAATATDWEVSVWYPTVEDAYSATQFIIHHASGDTTLNIDQTTNQGTWVYLGTFTMNAGTGNYVEITNLGTDPSNVVLADAIRFYSATASDTIPPVIWDVAASPGRNSAVITWTTDEPATSQVEYGLTASYGNETTKDTNLVTSHSVTITGLAPSMLYHYRVKSEDADGNLAVSGDYTFTTPEPEYRAVWADTWHSGMRSAGQVTTMVNTLADANCNVIIPEVRKCGDAYYDSAYEPRASNITDPPPFDPLGDLVTKAHAAGIEVHPWIVAYRIWNSNYGSAPPDHIWSLHPEWAMKTSGGSILDGSFYNLDPGVPGVQDYICKIVLDIVTNYDVDGFNWDYIRYPGTNWGYNEITKQRFYDEYGYWPPTSSGDPNWGTWCDYRRQQVTDLVKKCYLEIMAVKPHINHNVDTVGWMQGDPNVDFTQTRQYDEVFQDSKGWMEQHIIDANILMNYKREYLTDQAADFRLWSDWLGTMSTTSGRHSVDGIAEYLNSVPDTMTQTQYARSAGCDGLCFYSYASGGSDFWDALKNGPFATPVPTPDMPWKSAPTTGIIFGTVTDASDPNDPIYLDWIYKSQVDISGPVVQTTYTDATGTYGFLDLPPGTYTITCSKAGFSTLTYYDEPLAAGQVLRKDFDLGYTTATSPAGTVTAGWNLVSLPREPVNPDPVNVFSGIPIDANLYRWDKPTQSVVAYDEWMPGSFGNVNVEEGYWLNSASANTISYQAYAGAPAMHDISLPKAGWSIMGCPFLTDRQWADTEVTLGAQTVSLETARNNGWLSSLGYWWNSSTQSVHTLGLPDDWPDSEVVQPWHGYWIESYVDGLSLILQ